MLDLRETLVQCLLESMCSDRPAARIKRDHDGTWLKISGAVAPFLLADECLRQMRYAFAAWPEDAYPDSGAETAAPDDWRPE